MRELILAMSMSLDGFISGPEGEIDWIFSGDEEAIAWKVDNLADVGLHIMGSRTFRAMAAFWPTASGPFAGPMNDIPKAVFSGQGLAILEGATGSWDEAYVAGGELAAEIALLKSTDGKPIVAHGGAAFARSLIAEDLVDRYALMVHPVVLGKGLPIFSGVEQRRDLRLISSRAFPKGSVAQLYERG